MNERPLIMKMRQDYRFFGGISILYGIVFAFCLYKNTHGVTFPLCVAVTILTAGHFLFPALFQSAGDRSSVFCADDPSVL